MLTSMQKLLFATDFSQQCRPALETCRFFADKFGAGIVLLHVIDLSYSDYADEQLKATLGPKKWEQIMADQENDAREALIGKMRHEKIVDKVLQHYRSDAQINDRGKKTNWQEVVVSDKDVARAIVEQAKEHHCDFIVMGAKKSFPGVNTADATINQVMQQSEVPVMVVPSRIGR